MAKPINLENTLTGIKIFENQRIETMPYFIYEVSINKYWKNGFCVLGHKFYKSNKLLKTKDKIRYYDNYIISKEIILLGGPEQFTKDLPDFKLKKNGTRRSTKRSVH